MSRPPRHTIRRDPWRQPCSDSPRSGKAWRPPAASPSSGAPRPTPVAAGALEPPSLSAFEFDPNAPTTPPRGSGWSPIRCDSRSFSCCLVRVAPAIRAAKGLATSALMAGRPLHDRCCEFEIRPGVVAGRHAGGAFSASRVASGGGELHQTCGNAPTSSRTRIRSPIY